MKARSPMWAVWGWPIVFALLSATGLLCGLLGDGAWDWAAWLGLGLPTLAVLWFGLRRRG